MNIFIANPGEFICFVTKKQISWKKDGPIFDESLYFIIKSIFINKNDFK